MPHLNLKQENSHLNMIHLKKLLKLYVKLIVIAKNHVGQN